jgi:hypothetical protein
MPAKASPRKSRRRSKPNPAQALAVIHNELARSRNDMGIVALRLVMMMVEHVNDRGKENPLSHTIRVVDYAKRLGLSGSPSSVYTRLEKACDMLQGTKVETRHAIGERTKFTLVITATYRDKEGCVDLEFHPEMRPLLLSLKEYFCRIPMDVFFRIKNAHAAKFYLVCKSWDPSNAGNAAPGWRFTIDELRSWLWIQEDEYRHTPHLKSAVLERAKAELDEVADVSFEYEPFRQDGVIAGWEFTPVVNQPKRRCAAGRRNQPALPSPSDGPEPPPKPDYGPMADLWEQASDERRAALLQDEILRGMAPKEGERPRPAFLARLYALEHPEEVAA